MTKREAKAIGPTEAHIQQTVTEFLQFDGWRAIRTDPVSDRERGKGFGEKGMPDHLYVRYNLLGAYLNLPCAIGSRLSISSRRGTPSQWAEVLWIEFKRPGEKPRPHQLDWHEAERKRGALVLVVDDIDQFISWYKGSGLERRNA